MARRPEDRTPESFEDGPTNLDPTGTIPERREVVPASERNTGTYAGSPEFVAGREAGYEAGFKAGVDRAIAALRTELTRAGATPDEIDRVVARIKSVAKAGR
ncbi:MAG TPA: hypothetical protein VKQ32_05515 [Polyangia bacterium]|nr:hypothetical protein [Polyangia bacterium]